MRNYYEISHVNLKVSLAIWFHFEIQLVRGKDLNKLNPLVPIPRGEATPKENSNIQVILQFIGS